MAKAKQNLAIGSSSSLSLTFCDSPEKQQLNKLHRQPYRFFYFAFTPRKIRKQKAYEANLSQKAQVAKDWQRFLTAYFDGKLTTFEIRPKKQLGTDKIIWQYWGQGIDENLPPMVKLCFKSIDQHKGDYRVIRLSDETIDEYLDLPKFVTLKRQNPQFKPAFFADLLRLSLLSAYGGIWADATILLTAPIDKRIAEQEFFMFERVETVEDKGFWQTFNADYFGWHNTHYVNVLNSFIVANKRNDLLNHCLQILLNFWQTQDYIPHYFFFQIMYDVLTKQFIDGQKLIIDDVLPHRLQVNLSKPFDECTFNSIIKNTNIHKMTYMTQAPAGSYYEYLLKLYKYN